MQVMTGERQGNDQNVFKGLKVEPWVGFKNLDSGQAHCDPSHMARGSKRVLS